MPNHPPLISGQYYHIFNRGNNRENIFVEERNYAYFMQLYEKYIPPIADTFAYCLLINHFHLLVKIKDEPNLTSKADQSSLNPKPSLAFSRLFNAYAKGINKAYNRTGSLFQKPFNRIPITNQAHLLNLVAYIHQNPQTHDLIEDFRDWPYSSYQPLTTDSSSYLTKEETLSWFDGKEAFKDFHKTSLQENNRLFLENEF